jgi:hypothetical protein
MKTRSSPKHRQGGAVAVMVGISLVVLVGFLALVLDLARLYLARTGLQNAADAAALSGARQLVGTASGICCGEESAVAWARRTGGNNTFFGGDLSQVQVDIGPADTTNTRIRFSDSPDGPWVDIDSAQARPGDKYFIRVDTASGVIRPLFGAVWDRFDMGTFGMAVAGPIVKDSAPLGVCAVDVATSPTRGCNGSSGVNGASTVRECGFLRGVAYDIPRLNPIGWQAHPLLLNPVDVPPGSCDPHHSSANFTRPFICQGKAAGPNQIPGEVYANTGGSWGPVAAGLNSRFDLYTGPGKCDPDTAPPDLNIKRYAIGGGANQGRPRDWMNPDPTQQGIEIDGQLPQDYPARPDEFGEWGALWSYARERNWSTGSDYGLPDWNTLYGGDADTGPNGYPQVGGTPIPPYKYGLANPGSKYFDAPSSAHPGKANRRVLNMMIIDCNDPSYPMPGPGASCATVRAIGVGAFFMQVPADAGGSNTTIYTEFSGLLPASLFKKQYILYH